MTTIAEQQRAETVVDTAALPLFERIGGLPRIEWLVERFVDEMLSDRDLAPCLSGVDLASLKKTQAAFFTETGLEGLLILADMDRQKREAGTDRWRPSLWRHSV